MTTAMKKPQDAENAKGFFCGSLRSPFLLRPPNYPINRAASPPRRAERGDRSTATITALRAARVIGLE
jgi:hypothetical protein